MIHKPDMKNQTFTPTFSAIGLLKSKPIGIVTEEIKVSMTAAFQEFSAKKLNREKKPSIRKALAAAKDKAKQLNAARDKVKKMDRGREI